MDIFLGVPECTFAHVNVFFSLTRHDLFFATLTEQRMTLLHGLGGSRGLGGDMAVWHGGNRCGEWWGRAKAVEDTMDGMAVGALGGLGVEV